VAAAAHGHAFTERDLGGHAQCQFDFGAFGKRSVGEEEDSARTEILGESYAFNRRPGLAERQREEIRESLSDAAFNPNWEEWS